MVFSRFLLFYMLIINNFFFISKFMLKSQALMLYNFGKQHFYVGFANW